MGLRFMYEEKERKEFIIYQVGFELLIDGLI